MNAFAMRIARKSLPKTKNEARNGKKSRRTTQNDLTRTFSDSFQTQMRCKRCKRSPLRIARSSNETNGPRTLSSQFKTTQTRLLRTRRSSKQQKWTATHSSQSAHRERIPNRRPYHSKQTQQNGGSPPTRLRRRCCGPWEIPSIRWTIRWPAAFPLAFGPGHKEPAGPLFRA